MNSWQLAVGSWQLAVGSWQLAVGSWQLAVGSWQKKLITVSFVSLKLNSHSLISIMTPVFLQNERPDPGFETVSK